jgi:hypothetical protein
MYVWSNQSDQFVWRKYSRYILLISLTSVVQFWTLPPLILWFPNLFQHMVGLLGRVISSSQGLYLHRTTQRRKTRTNILALSGIWIRDLVYERSRPAPQLRGPWIGVRIYWVYIFSPRNYGWRNAAQVSACYAHTRTTNGFRQNLHKPIWNKKICYPFLTAYVSFVF